MGVSLQYHATRNKPLSESEREAILLCINQHGEPDVAEQCETFDFYDSDSPSSRFWPDDWILNGSTKVWESEEVRHWLLLLAKCRSLVPGADWTVKLEDLTYSYNEASGTYTPPEEPDSLSVVIPFSPDLDFTPEAFRDLVAIRAGCLATDSDAKIAESLRGVWEGEGKLLFSCAADMPADRAHELRTQRFLWAITGRLSFPGFEIEWLVNTESTKD